MTSKIGIDVAATFDSSAVMQGVNALGQKIRQAGKLKIDPVPDDVVKNIEQANKAFEVWLRLNSEMQRRAKVSGQAGSSFQNFKWDAAISNPALAAKKRSEFLAWASRFSEPRHAPPSGGSAGPAGPGAGAAMAAGAVQSGLRATGQAGGVAAGAVGTGMSAGFGAGLTGLMGGMLALGVSKLVGGVMEKVDQAQDNSVALDKLKRTLGDVNVSFAALKTVVNASGDNLRITYTEAGQLAGQFAKAANLSGDKAGSLGEEVGTGVGLSRGFGLDNAQGVGVLGQMRGMGVTSNTQDSRRFALLIGETIGKAGAFAKADEVMDAIAGYASSQTRNSMGGANVSGYSGMFSAMVGSGISGMDPSGASSMLARVNSALTGGGAKGEASQFFTGMVGQRMGLDTLQTQVMREGGAFATNNKMFGDDSAYSRYMGKAGPSGSSNFLEETRGLIEQQYGGNSDSQKLFRAQAFGNHTGLNMNQSMAMLSIKPGQMGGLEKYGDLKDFNASSILGLSKVQSGSDEDRGAIAADLGKRKDVSQAEKDALKKVMESGSVEEQKNMLSTLIATRDQGLTDGKVIREQKAVIDNINTSIADRLVPAVNAMRAGIIFMAGKGSMSENDIIKSMAVIDSNGRQETIKGDIAGEVAGAIGEQDAAGKKHKEALSSLKANYATMSPEERKAAQDNVSKLWEEKSRKEDEVRARIIALQEKKAELIKREVDDLAARLKGIDASRSLAGGTPGAGIVPDGAGGGGPGGDNAGDYDALFVKYGKKYGVDPKLLKTIAMKESGLKSGAVSPPNLNGSRDYGLMQHNSRYLAERGLSTEWASPERSIEEGAKLLSGNIKESGSVRGGVKKYNGSGQKADAYAGDVMARVGSTKISERATPLPDAGAERGPGSAGGGFNVSADDFTLRVVDERNRHLGTHKIPTQVGRASAAPGAPSGFR